MSDQPSQPRSLSEISHLFLSGVREKQQMGGGARPLRTPPRQRTDLTVDLSPEEFAHVFGEKAEPLTGPPIGPVHAVLASHLGAQQLARVQQYAAHCCQPGKRIGLICVDASEFRLSIFEHNPDPHPVRTEAADSGLLDPREMTQTLEELAWDVDSWLVLLPTPRAPEARSILRDIAQWTLLTTCDHEGVIACYRTVKGLSDLHRPRLTLAALDAASDADAAGAYQRLSSVCRQFLDWRIDNESPVRHRNEIAEHVVLWCSATRDKAQLATAPQWQVVIEFLERAKKSPAPEVVIGQRVEATAHATEPHAKPIPLPPQERTTAKPQAAEVDVSPMRSDQHESAPSEVIDLSNDHADASSIVSAVLKGGHDLVECPVKPPMCPDASLAVSREHQLILVAVARQGLCDLRQIGRAFQWLNENRALIGMAVPQMSIDAHQQPRLHLLVDHHDMSADILQPMLQSAAVTVHAYRKLRWGGKTGLLLEAA
jgi:hypothetical protein